LVLGLQRFSLMVPARDRWARFPTSQVSVTGDAGPNGIPFLGGAFRYADQCENRDSFGTLFSALMGNPLN
jgi:hypothetical protein